jgi:hypothetical protein
VAFATSDDRPWLPLIRLYSGSPQIKREIIDFLASAACQLDPHVLSIKGDVARACPLMAAITRLDANSGVDEIEFKVRNYFDCCSTRQWWN